MAELEFEWHKEKAQINLGKHKVSFEECLTIFHDLLVTTMSDPDHSDDEQRYIAIGQSVRKRILLVSYTERQNKTRIISCRRATPRERKAYEQGLF